jgi:D-arabinose 1-dehydrogenase-like Zn-dependent alcohol dehydrogenase
MSDKLVEYRSGKAPVPPQYRLWPLYGAGLENIGKDGKPIEVSLGSYGADELLIRHDACGLCFSDIKVINQGQTHPRIFKNMQTDPVVLGHEVSMTVVGVGENLKNEYQVGDRLTLETDIAADGKMLAYGYYFQGGLSQYSVIDRRIIYSDNGNNLIKLEPRMGYAESGLTEPWACVVAAYRLEYRTGLMSGGTTWIIGAGGIKPYTISAGFDEKSHPARLLLTNVPVKFAGWLKARAAVLGVEVVDVADVAAPPQEYVDDIVLLGTDPALIETVSPHLDQHAVLAILADAPMSRKVSVDVGRVHYHRWVYVGSTSADVADAYQRTPVRAALKKGGRAWFVGAGGPMGRMHVQRAIEFADGPMTMVCTDVSDLRLGELCDSFGPEAMAKGIEWVCLNPNNKEEYARVMAPYFKEGFDDIIMLVPVPPVISDAAQHLAPGGVMNVFAGVARGTMANLDLSDAYLRDNRVIGHSASEMADMQLVLNKWEVKQLSPNRSVAAIGSLSAARDGLKAVKDITYAGKVVIYPNIKEFPLTSLADLKEVLPTVYQRLDNGEWTNEAEEEFLRIMLP